MPFHAGAEPPQDQPTATPEIQTNVPAPVDAQSIESVVGNIIGNLMDGRPATTPSPVDNSAAAATTTSPSTTANAMISTTDSHVSSTAASTSFNAELHDAQTASATPAQSQLPATKPALRPGVIVSIVIMSLLIIALVAGGVVFWLKRKRSIARQKEQSEYDVKDEGMSRPESFAKSFHSNSSFATGNGSQQHLDMEQRTIGGDSHMYGEGYSTGSGSEFDTTESRRDLGEHYDRQTFYSQYSESQSDSQATDHAYEWSVLDGRSNASVSGPSHSWQDQMVYGGGSPMSDRTGGAMALPSRFSDSTLSTQPSQFDRPNFADPWQGNGSLEHRATPPLSTRTPSPFTPAVSAFSPASPMPYPLPSAISSRFPSPGPSRIGTPQSANYAPSRTTTPGSQRVPSPMIDANGNPIALPLELMQQRAKSPIQLPPSAVQSTGLAAHDFRNTLWPALSPAVPRGTSDPTASNTQSQPRLLPTTPAAAAADDDDSRQTMWFSSHDSAQQYQPTRPMPAYLPSGANDAGSRRTSMQSHDQQAPSSRWSLSMAATAGSSRSGSASTDGPYGNSGSADAMHAPGAGHSTAARAIMAHRKTRHLSIPSYAVELPASLPSPRGSPNDEDDAGRWSIDSLLALIDPENRMKAKKVDAPMARSKSASD